jgi:hypothetical protein
MLLKFFYSFDSCTHILQGLAQTSERRYHDSLLSYQLDSHLTGHMNKS